VIESVQPPSQFAAKNAKGNSLAFMTIYLEDPSAFESVEHVFLTGFPVPEEAYERLRADGKEVSTTWGSTETMALGTYVKGCQSLNVNHLLATGFPTVGMVARYRERDVDFSKLEEVEVGRDGLLLVTSLIGGGSTYLNYMIGDLCIKNERGYTDINRATADLNIAGSCAEDALTL
jgi:acyl-coenzyme A synthetase/AMP-(fatty) acid ligase